MQKNVAGQKIGCQLVSASDGSAFTGSVTVYITGDAGTQAIGSVGAGACAHEGNGYHTYAPAQAETNYDLIAFTFVGAGAITQTLQVYPDATVASRAIAGDAMTLTSGERSAVGTAVWASGTRTLTAFSFSVTVGTNNDKTGYALTSGERTSIANEVEAQIIDDTDSEKVLTAITDKIASVNPSLDDLTLAGIASAVRTELAVELARIDASVASRASQTSNNTIAGYIDTEVANIVAGVADLQNRVPAALGANGNMKADVRDFNGSAATATGGRPEVIVTGDAATAGTRFLTMIELDAAVYRFTENSLEMGPGGEGGASVNVASFDVSALNQLSAFKTITTVGPVISNTRIKLVQGDDYLEDDDRQLPFPNPLGNWPDLAGATVTLTIWRDVDGEPIKITATGEIVTAAGVDQQVDVELTAAKTIDLDVSDWEFDLVARWTGPRTVTLRRGKCEAVVRPWIEEED